jgi:hypothetical protein
MHFVDLRHARVGHCSGDGMFGITHRSRAVLAIDCHLLDGFLQHFAPNWEACRCFLGKALVVGRVDAPTAERGSLSETPHGNRRRPRARFVTVDRTPHLAQELCCTPILAEYWNGCWKPTRVENVNRVTSGDDTNGTR